MSNFKRSLASVLGFVFIVCPAVAKQDKGISVDVDKENRLVYVTGLQKMSGSEKMKIIRGEAELTDYEKYLATEFRLTPDDMKKYKKIMVGKRGIWSPGLDPLSALGVEEKDKETRERYAKLWLEVEAEKVDLQFEFERAVAAKRKEVFGDMLPFNSQPKIDAWLKKQGRPNANIDVFVQADCLSQCQKSIHQVQRTRGRGRLNFFFVGEVQPSDNDIVQWAKFHEIPAEQVKSRVITLNNGQKKFKATGKKISNTRFPFTTVTQIEYQDKG